MFQLAGKQNVVRICEPMSLMKDRNPRQPELTERFAHALEAFYRGDRRIALVRFEALLGEFADDGPTRFYIDYISRKSETSSSPDAVIRLSS